MGPLPRPPTRLEAGPTELRAISEEDWQIEVALSHDPEVVRWTYYRESMDEDAARGRVRVSVERAAAGIEQRYVIWGGDNALGTCGISHLDSDEPHIMYALLPAFRGLGRATAATVALAAWADGVGYSKVRLETIEGNVASERVATKAGFALLRSAMEDHRGRQVMLHTWERELTDRR